MNRYAYLPMTTAMMKMCTKPKIMTNICCSMLILLPPLTLVARDTPHENADRYFSIKGFETRSSETAQPYMGQRRSS